MVALVDQTLFSTTNFLTGVIIGRACSQEEFGLYILGFSIVLVLLDLQISIISTPYMVYSPRLKGRALAEYTGSTLVHQLVLCALAILALIGGGALFSFSVGPQTLTPVMWALAAAITFIMLRDYVRRLCFARLRMKSALLLDLFVAVVQISGMILFATLGILSASRAYWVIGAASGITSVGWLVSNRKAFALGVNDAISDFARNWSFGKWVFASGLLWAISMNLYPWILATLHGAASTGIWGACFGTIAVGNIPMTGVQNYLGPKIASVYAEGDIAALRRFVLKAGALFGCLMMFFFLVLLILGDLLVVLLYGDKYAGYGFIISILALSLVPAAAGFSLSRGLFVIERADVDLKVNLLPLLILFTLGIWLVQSYGPLGAAYGLLVANTAATGMRWAAFSILTRHQHGSQTG